ncbi:D-alanine--D-alanine ligase [Parvularcula sp. IMCC14364]|uniref:D-alanine--D-alanine ligase n=1 Tax=Parvularcula sp. IMCC14364 TaxID=3067902 RepID=UPI0027428369|nr:D-alanine--D-alanine ligase [Parvularcula sp. IMCC14364]
MKKSQKIAVLKGGWSPEREVSLVSGKAAADALRELGHEVEEIDATRDLAAQLLAVKPDLVFNGLHGEWGEDGCVQGLLEVLGMPYTHSGVLASSLAMDKERTKQLLKSDGLPVPDGALIRSRAEFDRLNLMPPLVIKPNASGSSVNIHILRDGDNRPLHSLIGSDEDLAAGVLIEAYIPGRELTVAVMGDRALEVTEIVPHKDFYDYEAKYADGGSSHVVPAQLSADIAEACREMALRTHQLVGCRGLTRTDFRYDESRGVNGLFILEINTQPGLTPTSLAPEQALARGISFTELVDWMIGDASCRR